MLFSVLNEIPTHSQLGGVWQIKLSYGIVVASLPFEVLVHGACSAREDPHMKSGVPLVATSDSSDYTQKVGFYRDPIHKILNPQIFSPRSRAPLIHSVNKSHTPSDITITGTASCPPARWENQGQSRRMINKT
jgi:hypothetical protein